MAIIKCKMCGGDLELIPESTVCECEYCGTKQTVPNADNEKKLNLFTRANRLRAGCEFDKAAGVFETIVADFPEEAEAYWGLVLCKYGIEYVDDPATGNKIPTCHRSSFESVMEDANLELTLEYADAVAHRVYRQEAKAIEEIRKGIIEVSAREEPYDIFICYKETGFDGQRTLDSVLAQDIYTALTREGYRVFFSRITLEDKLGVEYEPYIFAALNSAKVMLSIGTDFDHFNAVWVKNEWSRFLKLMASDHTKHLIPCYKDIDAYDMPKEFGRLQAQDLGKIGAMQDLLRGIEKLLPKKQTQQETVVIQQGPNVSAMVKRGQFALEDGDFAKADEYFDRALDQNAEDSEAYLGKVLVKLRLASLEELLESDHSVADNKDFLRAVRFAVGTRKQELEAALEALEKKRLVCCFVRGIHKVIIQKNKELERQQAAQMAYDRAKVQLVEAKDESSPIRVRMVKLKAAWSYFKDKDFLDSEQMCGACAELYNQLNSNFDYYDAVEGMDRVTSAEGFLELAGIFARFPQMPEAARKEKECRLNAEKSRMEDYYLRAKKEMQRHSPAGYMAAIPLLERASGFKDADALRENCQMELQRIRQLAQEEIARNEEQARQERQRQEQRAQLERQRQEEQARQQQLTWQKLQAKWRGYGLCQHCGGALKGLFSKKCSVCGRPKDY